MSVTKRTQRNLPGVHCRSEFDESDSKDSKIQIVSPGIVPYFFGYKTEFFPFQNNPKDLDPSCKMDLDLWDCLGRVKLVL